MLLARVEDVHRGGAARRLVGAARGAQLAVAADDDEELPWQVIAILDIDILEQPAGTSTTAVRRGVAGRGVVAPPAALEGAAAAGEGRWVAAAARAASLS